MSLLPVYVMIVATVNLALGFAISAYLGRRYRFMMASAGVAGGATKGHAEDESASASSQQHNLLAAQSDSHTAEQPQRDAAVPPDAVQSDNADDFAALAAQIGGTRVDSPSADAAEAPAANSAPNAAIDGQGGQAPSGTMAHITGMRREVEQYQSKLTETDEALRSRIGPADAAEIEAALSGLLAATEEYLKVREQLHKNLEESWPQQEQLAPVRQQVAEAIHSQDEHIRASRQVFEGFDPEGDVAAQHSQAVSQTSKLASANYRLRDALEEAAVRVSVADGPAGQPESLAAKDEMTGVDNRAALEARVRQWQQRDPHGIRRLSMAVIDVDRCAKLNEQYGPKVVDRLLSAIGQILLGQTRDQCDCARLAGQRFALFCPDAPVRSVTQLVERIRQIIELTHFHAGEQDIQVTVSCAVTALHADEQYQDFFSRLEGALREAKSYGRNRTFVHEGDYPTPVVPPNFSLEEKHITL